MNKIYLSVISLLVIASFSFNRCSKENTQFNHSDLAGKVPTVNPDTVELGTSMKGWEIYSWKTNDIWYHSLMPGTNMLKDYSGVTTNNLIVSSTSGLKELLNKLPEDEQVFWISRRWMELTWMDDYRNLELPENTIILEVITFCETRNIHLQVTD